jgi:hypothetical protein
MRGMGNEAAMKKRRPGTHVVGRQFSRRTVAVARNDTEFVRLDSFDYFTPKKMEQHKLAAIQTLETAGIAASNILAEYPGGSMLRDYVLNTLGHDADSAIGLAARICEMCIRLQELPASGANASMLLGEAYRLGRLLTLSHAYGIQDQSAAKARANRALDTGDRKADALRRADEMQRRNPSLSDRDVARRLEGPLAVPAETIRGWLKKRR